jgi:hypothetical protein
VKRLQTAVKADFVLGIKFAEWWGLKSEGLMKHYGPDGADYIRFAKIYWYVIRRWSNNWTVAEKNS